MFDSLGFIHLEFITIYLGGEGGGGGFGARLTICVEYRSCPCICGIVNSFDLDDMIVY